MTPKHVETKNKNKNLYKDSPNENIWKQIIIKMEKKMLRMSLWKNYEQIEMTPKHKKSTIKNP